MSISITYFLMDVKNKLKQLNELQKEGLISEEEFFERKNDILNSL